MQSILSQWTALSKQANISMSYNDTFVTVHVQFKRSRWGRDSYSITSTSNGGVIRPQMSVTLGKLMDAYTSQYLGRAKNHTKTGLKVVTLERNGTSGVWERINGL